MAALFLLAVLAQGGTVVPESGEVRLRNVHQLTFGGQNAEAYFSSTGKLLIFQRQGVAEQCDQMYVMSVDGRALRRVSSGRGRTTCGYFYDHDRPFIRVQSARVWTVRRGPTTPRATCGRSTTTTFTPPTPTARAPDA